MLNEDVEMLGTGKHYNFFKCISACDYVHIKLFVGQSTRDLFVGHLLWGAQKARDIMGPPNKRATRWSTPLLSRNWLRFEYDEWVVVWDRSNPELPQLYAIIALTDVIYHSSPGLKSSPRWIIEHVVFLFQFNIFSICTHLSSTFLKAWYFQVWYF